MTATEKFKYKEEIIKWLMEDGDVTYENAEDVAEDVLDAYETTMSAEEE